MELRASAIAHVRALERRHGILRWSQIADGFVFRGETVLLANRPRGIFAPAGVTTGALSIKTNIPREGRARRYDDQIAGGDPFFRYAYQGENADARDNVALRKCLERALPVIYFYGVAETLYRPLICRIVDEDREAQRFHVAPASDALAGITAEAGDGVVRAFERRYSMSEVRRRLHQDKFREAVLDAYEKRCAICALRHPELLEAAHIIPDRERLGEAKVPNGLSLCKLHHAAYDAEMLGITPDGVIKLSGGLLEERDGPMLEHGLRAFHDGRLWRPRARSDWPDRDLLAERWTRFAA